MRMKIKKTFTVFFSVLLVLSLSACGGANEKAEAQPDSAQEQTTAATPDGDWILPETTEMTEAVTAMFEKAMDGLVGVNYEPLGFLGVKDGVYCILCRATLVYPDAKPYYALVYVDEEGVRNIWDIWMGAHAEKKD